MKVFIKNLIVFIVLLLIIGEIMVRVTHSVIDVPQRTIDEKGIQKYIPLQEGYWKDGSHKWKINKLGWAGKLPDNYDNLITIIGDSYIENFMNPDDCHQAVYLKQRMPQYNYLEAARAGVSLVEAMEIDKQLDSLKPLHTLIYVNNNDFYESVYDIKPLGDITQVNLKTKTINYGKLKSPRLKLLLYNWKLLYYFYNRFPLNLEPNKNTTEEDIERQKYEQKNEVKVIQFIDFIDQNYQTNNKTLIFHPNSNKAFIEKCKSVGINVVVLNSSLDKTWTFEYDSHWTCYGHSRVATQISEEIIAKKILN